MFVFMSTSFFTHSPPLVFSSLFVISRLHSMHLKSIGAIVARTLSYEACEFELIEDVSDDNVRKIYNDAANLWSKYALHSYLTLSLVIRL